MTHDKEQNWVRGHGVPDPVRFEFDRGMTSTKLQSPLLRYDNRQADTYAIMAPLMTVISAMVGATYYLLAVNGIGPVLLDYLIMGFVALVTLYAWVQFDRTLRSIRRTGAVTVNRDRAERRGYIESVREGSLPKMADRVVFPDGTTYEWGRDR